MGLYDDVYAAFERADVRLVPVASKGHLIEIAEASGALQRARDDKQREIDALWAR